MWSEMSTLVSTPWSRLQSRGLLGNTLRLLAATLSAGGDDVATWNLDWIDDVTHSPGHADSTSTASSTYVQSTPQEISRLLIIQSTLD